MKEILFRGKRNPAAEWVYGYPFIQAEGTEYEEAFILGSLDHRDSVYDIWKCAERVDPKTICQFTGLLDKNGTRIFEGDIICDLDGDVEVVKFVKSRYYYPFVDSYDHLWWVEDECEIVGNVHDNPELLEERK